MCATTLHSEMIIKIGDMGLSRGTIKICIQPGNAFPIHVINIISKSWNDLHI